MRSSLYFYPIFIVTPVCGMKMKESFLPVSVPSAFCNSLSDLLQITTARKEMGRRVEKGGFGFAL